ncbi:MAG: dephospho-CoA kinase [Thermoleophilia bacterium]|nr:dephospho-CoA kinase [Thermoleophilia bacterium]
MTQERHEVVAVGLTGGIGAGKSTALALFGEMGALTLSADKVVHDLYRQRGLSAEIAAYFGAHVLDGAGRVDRARLGEEVRGRVDRLRWLESLIHPRVTKRIKRRIKAAPPGTVLVVEVPLLFEADLAGLFDMVVTIEAGEETRRRRSIHAFDLGQFAELEELQASTKRRVEGSDLVFFNDGTLDDLRRFVHEAHERARSLLGHGR